MYSQVLFLAFGAMLAQAQFGNLPTCAGGCIPHDLGGCNIIDYKCICTNKSLLDQLACCVSTACDAADQDATIQYAKNICGSNANTSALPTTATCASSTASSSSTGTGSGSTSPQTQAASTTPSSSTATMASTTQGGQNAAATQDLGGAGRRLEVGVAAAAAGLLAAAL